MRWAGTSCNYSGTHPHTVCASHVGDERKKERKKERKHIKIIGRTKGNTRENNEKQANTQTNKQTRKDIATYRTYFVNQFISTRKLPQM